MKLTKKSEKKEKLDKTEKKCRKQIQFETEKKGEVQDWKKICLLITEVINHVTTTR